MSRGPDKALTVDEFKQKFEDYCEHCDDTKEKPTMSGAAWFMGFASRQSMWDYGKDDDYAYPVARVRLFIEKFYEQQLANGRGDGGLVFALKNLGWSDKQELDHTSSDNSMTPAREVRELTDEELERIVGRI